MKSLDDKRGHVWRDYFDKLLNENSNTNETLIEDKNVEISFDNVNEFYDNDSKDVIEIDIEENTNTNKSNENNNDNDMINKNNSSSKPVTNKNSVEKDCIITHVKRGKDFRRSKRNDTRNSTIIEKNEKTVKTMIIQEKK